MVSDGIADTNELFIRSYQMLQMFEGKATVSEAEEPTQTRESLNEIKIGKLARIMIPKVLQSGKVPYNAFLLMFTAEYSKKVFDINYPVLAWIENHS